MKAKKTKKTKAGLPPLVLLVRDFLLGLGAAPGKNGYDFRVETACGPLDVQLYPEWVACRFEDVEAAKSCLPHGSGDRLNPHSGKWNFHYFGCDDMRRAAREFAVAVDGVLA